MALGMSVTLRNARLDAITTAIGNAGKLKLYNGVQPATSGTATTLLATLILGTPPAPGTTTGPAVLSVTIPYGGTPDVIYLRVRGNNRTMGVNYNRFPLKVNANPRLMRVA